MATINYAGSFLPGSYVDTSNAQFVYDPSNMSWTTTTNTISLEQARHQQQYAQQLYEQQRQAQAYMDEYYRRREGEKSPKVKQNDATFLEMLQGEINTWLGDIMLPA